MAEMNQAPAPAQTGNTQPEALPNHNTQITTTQQAPQAQQPAQSQQQPASGPVKEIPPKDMPPTFTGPQLMAVMAANQQRKQEQGTTTAPDDSQPGDTTEAGNGPIIQPFSGPHDGPGNGDGNGGGNKPGDRNKPADPPPEPPIDPKVAIEDTKAIHENRATPEQTERYTTTMQLSEQQKKRLEEGKDTEVPRWKLDYIKYALGTIDQIVDPGDGQPGTKKFDDFGGNNEAIKQATGNGLQIVSNQKVVANPPASNGGYNRGGWDLLPKSVKEDYDERSKYPFSSEHKSGAYYLGRVLGRSDKRLKQGTDVDHKLIEFGREMTRKRVTGEYPVGAPTNDATLQAINAGVAGDKEVIAALVTGKEGEQFVKDLNSIRWGDGGEAAGALLSQSRDDALVTKPGDPADERQAKLTGTIASTIAKVFGDAANINVDATGQSIGKTNPKLVRGMATTMAAYGRSLSGGAQKNVRNFDIRKLGLDYFNEGAPGSDQPLSLDQRKNLPMGPLNLFAALNTDAEAGVTINAGAYAAIRELQSQFATGKPHGRRSAELTQVGILKSLVDKGMAKADEVGKNNEYQDQAGKYKLRALAYDKAAEWTANIPVAGVAVDHGGDLLKRALIGAEPTEPSQDETVYENGLSRLQYAIIASAPDLQQKARAGRVAGVDNFFVNGKLRSYEDLINDPEVGPQTARDNISDLLDSLSTVNAESLKMQWGYDYYQ